MELDGTVKYLVDMGQFGFVNSSQLIQVYCYYDFKAINLLQKWHIPLLHTI